jgi:NADP-dependent 3-hydroxy acid dehydrogenase YdfG
MVSTVLITGASSGIGEATVRRFEEAGWNVVATMRQLSGASTTAGDSKRLNLRMDVTDVASIEQAVMAATARFGRIDVVVNNAGYALVGPFEASTTDQVERQIGTNVIGLMNVTRAVLPQFRFQGKGLLINVASVGGRITFPLYSVYHATKWAVEGFSESLVFELEPLGISVKIIEPGPIRTAFYGRSQDLMHREGLTAYDRYVARVANNIQRFGSNAPGPELVAETIYRAATDGKKKIRYPVNARQLLWARRLLPTRWFMGLIRRRVE